MKCLNCEKEITEIMADALCGMCEKCNEKIEHFNRKETTRIRIEKNRKRKDR